MLVQNENLACFKGIATYRRRCIGCRPTELHCAVRQNRTTITNKEVGEEAKILYMVLPVVSDHLDGTAHDKKARLLTYMFPFCALYGANFKDIEI